MEDWESIFSMKSYFTQAEDDGSESVIRHIYAVKYINRKNVVYCHSSTTRNCKSFTGHAGAGRRMAGSRDSVCYCGNM